jgi:ubiquinone/menaquinone biosynthesis C-methylase UbiE
MKRSSHKKSPSARHASRPWFIQAFGKDYLERYAHRSDKAARADMPFLKSALRARKGALILDLCCGAGRYSRALAAEGYSVAAVDLSPDLLRAAAMQSRRNVRYARADMRRLPFKLKIFDGAVNLFTSFGYFNDDENLDVLKGAARVLKPGARLVLDFFNREYVLRHIVARTCRCAGTCMIEERRWLDRRSGRLNKSTRYLGGKSRRSLRESVRAYTPAELERLFRRAGFKIIGRYGSLQGERFDRKKSQRCVIVGQRKS